jgi:hypothetical protein
MEETMTDSEQYSCCRQKNLAMATIALFAIVLGYHRAKVVLYCVLECVGDGVSAVDLEASNRDSERKVSWESYVGKICLTEGRGARGME